MRTILMKHKKIGILILLVIIISLISVFVSRAGNLKKERQNTGLIQETALVEKRTLVDSISASGTVTSIESKDVTANVTGVKVESISVKAGDVVKEGDVICILDSTDIEADLQDAKTSLSATSAKTTVDLTAAERSFNEAQVTRNIEIERSNQDVADAWNDYLMAVTDAEEAEADYNDAINTTNEKRGEYEYRKELLEEAEESLNNASGGNTAQNSQLETEFSNYVNELKGYLEGLDDKVTVMDGAYDNLYLTNTNLSTYTSQNIVTVNTDALGDTDSGEISATVDGYLSGLKDIQTRYQQNVDSESEYQKLQSEYQELSAEVSTWEQKYNSAQTNENSLKTAYEQAITTADSKLDTYNQKVRSKDDTVRNNDSTVSTKEENLKNSQLNATTSGLSDKQQIEQYEEQIAECTVTAPISGVITAVNVEEGANYSGAAIVSIEDISDYEITCEIDEYDISKIQIGQKTIIRTNGTGDKEFEGTVAEIAPRATSGGTNVTYTVGISIDSSCSELRMDMTAKLSIILESKENVLTVPYDAVQEDEKGNFYIEVLAEETEEITETEEIINPEEEEGVQNTQEVQIEKVIITKGIESDYYVEIKGTGLKEGMKVVVPLSDSEDADVNGMMGGMGPMGGF